MKKKVSMSITARRRRIWFSAIITAVLLAIPASKALAAGKDKSSADNERYEISAKAIAKSQSSVKVTMTKNKHITHWKIRVATIPDAGKQQVFKTVKTLKVSTRAYTLKKLKKNTVYNFEIVGCRKVNGKLEGVIYDYTSAYTGISNVAWDDYASSDAPCSPKFITLTGHTDNDGFSISGLELYQKEKGGINWKKIANIKKKSFTYKDKNVKGGHTYYYRFRSYGRVKGKKMYSPYSEQLCLSAVNQTGTFKSVLISRDKDSIVVKIKSAKYNGELKLRSRDELQAAPTASEIDDNEGIPVTITAVSDDGKTWTSPGEKGKVKLKGGESIYLKLSPAVGSHVDSGNMDSGNMESGNGESGNEESRNTDLSLCSYIGSDGSDYNRLPSYFSLNLEEGGSAWPNTEMIH